MSFQKSIIKLGNFKIEKSSDASFELMYNNVIKLAEKMILSEIEILTANNIVVIFAAVFNQMVTIKARVVQMSAKKIIKTHMEKNLPSCCVSSVDLDKHYTLLLSDATKYCFKPKFQNYNHQFP